MIIAYCTDYRLYEHTYTAVMALMKHNRQHIKHIHIFVNEGMSEETCANISTPLITYHSSDDILAYLDEDSIDAPDDLGIMTYARLALPFVLEEEKVLYLDVDTLVRDDISDFYNMDISNYYAAGVTEPKKSKPGQPYFNAGVLLMNLRKIREDKVHIEWLRLAQSSRKFTAHDQDIINEICCTNILKVDPTYNSCPFTAEVDNPKIVHGTRPTKPWNPSFKYYDEWMQYSRKVKHASKNE